MQTIKSFLLNSRILLVLLVLVLFAGCSDDEGSTGEPGTLDRLWSHSTIQGCVLCHEGGETGPNLSKATFVRDLVGRSSREFNWDEIGRSVVANNCDSYSLVDKGFPARSAVLFTISDTYGLKAPCDSAYQAHLTTLLTKNELKDFEDWIINGAPR